MKNAKGDGKTIKFTAAAAITSGDEVLIGKLLGVAVDDVANGAEGIAFTEGVFSLTKKGTDVVAQGDSLYWDSSAGELTKTATANQYAGTAWAAAGSGATVVDIKINPGNKDVVA